MRDPALASALRAWNGDLGVVAAYGRLLPQALLDVPRLGMINVHASLLPKYRGAAPVQRAVMAGESETGVTIMRVVQELDAGPMLGSRVVPIGPDDTSEGVESALAFLGAALLCSVVDEVAAGRAVEEPQDVSGATYAPRLSKSDGLIDWSRPARRIHDQIRGLHPWPHAFTFLGRDRYIVLKSRLGPVTVGSADRERPHGRLVPGEILAATGDELVVSCGDTALVILEIQAEGRRAQPVREFLSGHPLHPGQRFGE
jgi:methionyl-tRNA formyltransferase